MGLWRIAFKREMLLIWGRIVLCRCSGSRGRKRVVCQRGEGVGGEGGVAVGGEDAAGVAVAVEDLVEVAAEALAEAGGAVAADVGLVGGVVEVGVGLVAGSAEDEAVVVGVVVVGDDGCYIE